MDPEEDVINHKTIKFLRHASALPLANLHLKADLAVSSKNYGSATSKREILCTKCCLKLTHDRLVFKIKKLTKKRQLLTSNCTYCGQEVVSMVLKSK